MLTSEEDYKSMSHYKDLRDAYAHRMAFHGFGHGLYHPVGAEDLVPPCCGFFDRNGDWNLICSISTEQPAPNDENGWEPLEYMPKKTMDIGIEWQPKTSLGTQEHVFSGSVDTPDNQPAGAEAKVAYSSSNKFGAVLMTRKPVTLTAYNDERLFLRWLEVNRKRLYDRYGPQLRKYGFWLVTRTYTCPAASINAWTDSNKSTEISAKAKATMLGELGEDLDWKDRITSRDWSNYAAKSDAGIAVFIDGIDMSPFDWRIEGVRQSLPFARDPGSPRRRSLSVSPQPDTLQLPQPAGEKHADARRASLTPPQAASAALASQYKRQSLQLPDRPPTWYSDELAFADESTLRDVGLQLPLSRSRSTRSARSVSPSLASVGTQRTSRSLRRETRSISSDRPVL